MQIFQRGMTGSRFPTFNNQASNTDSSVSSASTSLQQQQQQTHEVVAVDGEEMFIASNLNKQEYFVLL